jgi:hypothetical protein
MEKLSDSTIEEYVQQKLEGKSYSEIKSRLRESGLSDEAVREAIRQIDDRVLREEVSRVYLKRSRQIYWAGITLAILGLCITIAFNAGLLLAGRSRVLVYSPFFAGIILMAYARMMQRKTHDPFERKPGKIRNKRPNKW